MSKEREKADEKQAAKRSIYDNIEISQRALSIIIVFGLIAAALAITCGYFMGNGEENVSQQYNSVYVAENRKASPIW